MKVHKPHDVVEFVLILHLEQAKHGIIIKTASRGRMNFIKGPMCSPKEMITHLCRCLIVCASVDLSGGYFSGECHDANRKICLKSIF